MVLPKLGEIIDFQGPVVTGKFPAVPRVIISALSASILAAINDVTRERIQRCERRETAERRKTFAAIHNSSSYSATASLEITAKKRSCLFENVRLEAEGVFLRS